jgi:hypothetical protein
MKQLDYTNLRKITRQENEKLRLYFFKMKGLDTIKRVFKTKAYDLTFDSQKVKYYDFVHSIHKGSALYIEESIKLNYPRILIKRSNNYLKSLFLEQSEAEEPEEEDQKPKLTAKQKQQIFTELEEIFNLLICFTEERNARIYFREKSHLLIPIFSNFYKNLIQEFKSEHYLISNIINFFSNLLITEVGNSNSEIRDYLISHYLPYFFSSIGLMLKEKSLKFLNLKKSCMSFLSNLMISPKVRAHCVKHLRDIEGLKSLKDVEKMEKNGVYFFFENLFLDSIRVLEKIVKNHGQFGANTTKYFENVFSLVLNMVYKVSQKELLDLNETMNSMKLVNVILQVLRNLEKMKTSIEAEKWQILMKRGVNILSKFYKGGMLDNKVILEVLEKLLELYVPGNGGMENLIVNAETNKLLVVLMNKGESGELVEAVLELVKNVGNGAVFEAVASIVKGGSEASLVR